MNRGGGLRALVQALPEQTAGSALAEVKRRVYLGASGASEQGSPLRSDVLMKNCIGPASLIAVLCCCAASVASVELCLPFVISFIAILYLKPG